MSKKVFFATIACVALILGILAVGVLYKPGRKHNFCMSTLTEQVEAASAVYVAQVVNSASVGGGEKTLQCTYEVLITEELASPNDSLGKKFNIVEAYGGRPVGHPCKNSGDLVLVILSEGSTIGSTQTCAFSAVVDITEKNQVLNLLPQ